MNMGQDLSSLFNQIAKVKTESCFVMQIFIKLKSAMKKSKFKNSNTQNQDMCNLKLTTPEYISKTSPLNQ